MGQAPVLFRGIGHSVNPANTLHTYKPKDQTFKSSLLTGSAISLVSVVQARNNARVLICGSLDLFSNRFLRYGVLKSGSSNKHDKSGNEQFVTEISKWVFHERGHLKVFSVEIYEWSGSSWRPYVADDVQVQFYMMSPYVLKNLPTDEKVEYQRLGYTSLSLSKQIPVRPFSHNEYERFIPAAFPYYGASFSTMVGFFIFTVVYLYNK
ncbi:hypothetical protein HPP92_009947 [Vanilla planifolia]|uniref:Dolichyl-diphosphooligosaccharide--protein glycosyltransferase 48 kDa subunit n=1 Tax=Vanilla planifolia TaxID=51239 RepID=A0A835R8L3_VANPL|nr:hypothetical protein HPP92_009947 [Vanilla planifolia]